MSATLLRVAVSVESADPSVIMKANEVLARAAIGLLLDGVEANFMLYLVTEEDDR